MLRAGMGAERLKIQLVKDLGIDSAAARRRWVAQTRESARLRHREAEIPQASCEQNAGPRCEGFCAHFGTWGDQGQGMSPKRLKVIRAAAGSHCGRLAFVSPDLVFYLAEHRLIQEHWPAALSPKPEAPKPQSPKAPKPQSPKAPKPQSPKAPKPQSPKAPKPQSPKPYTVNPKPQTPNPKPQTPNPKP